jgi:hypothetical protein
MVPVTRPTFPITCWSANRIPVSLGHVGPLPLTHILTHFPGPVCMLVISGAAVGG